jgi:hypothetical protein
VIEKRKYVNSIERNLPRIKKNTVYIYSGNHHEKPQVGIRGSFSGEYGERGVHNS